MTKNLGIRHIIAEGIIIAFLVNSFGPLPMAQADEFHLPAPGVMVNLVQFNPPILKGIKVHPDNPFRFDFILDKGDSELSNDQIKDESSKLIKYFLASLTIPEKDLWVNLSPYEKDRIIPQSFGLTGMGRDLLAEDYMLKQITASLIYPEDEIGKKFWKRIYEEAEKKFGTTNIPVNTFNKVWIVPEEAVVYENAKAGTAYVVESRLKVMLEQDYLSLQKHEGSTASIQGKETNQLGSQIAREIVIPELTKEVNEGKNFVQLRQVYNSLILAAWYKKKIKDSILALVYTDKNKVAGVNIDDPQEKEKIYRQYLQAFKKGVYNYIKDEQDPMTRQTIPRKYFSGGINATRLAIDDLKITHDFAMVAAAPNELIIQEDTAMVSAINMNNIHKQIISENLVTELLSLADRLSKGHINVNDPDLRQSEEQALGQLVDLIKQGQQGSLNVLERRLNEAKSEDEKIEITDELGSFYIEMVNQRIMTLDALESSLQLQGDHHLFDDRLAKVKALGILTLERTKQGQKVSLDALESGLREGLAPAMFPAVINALAPIYAEMVKQGMMTVDSLESRLQVESADYEHNSDVRRVIVKTLGIVYADRVREGHEVSLDLLESILQKKDPHYENRYVRPEIINVLGQVYAEMVKKKRKVVLNLLEKKLQREEGDYEEDWTAHIATVKALGIVYLEMVRQGQKVSLDILERKLQSDEAGFIHHAVVNALGQIYAEMVKQGHQVSLDVFESRLQEGNVNYHFDWQLIIGLVKGLGAVYGEMVKKRQKVSLDILESKLKIGGDYNDRNVRQAIIDTLGQLYAEMVKQGMMTVDAFESSLQKEGGSYENNSDRREAIVKALGIIYVEGIKQGHEVSVAVLENKLKPGSNDEDNSDVREAIVKALGSVYTQMIRQGMLIKQWNNISLSTMILYSLRYPLTPTLFQQLWDFNEMNFNERERVVNKRRLLSALVHSMHNESLRQVYMDSKVPFIWLYQISQSLDPESFMVAIHLTVMAGMFLKENGEFSIQKMVTAYANQLLDDDKQLPTLKIEGDALKIFKFGDRSYIKLLPKPKDAPKGYRPRFEVSKQFLPTDIDDNKKGLGFISESRQLPVLAQLHGGRVKFIKAEPSQRIVVYEAEDRLFIYSTEEMVDYLREKELMQGYKETLVQTISQIYNLWGKGKVHTAVSRLMHSDRNGDNRPWVYMREESLDQMGEGIIAGALSGNPRGGGNIRHMTNYMGQDSNIRWRMGLVDAEHIVDTDDVGQFWASLFDMVMNFSYSGVYVNNLNNDQMWEIFSALKFKYREGDLRDVFRDRTALEELWNAMREHIDGISYSEYGNIKKYIEFSLPRQMKEMPEAIVSDGQGYAVGIHIIKSELKPVVGDELTAARRVMANPQLVPIMVADSVKATKIIGSATVKGSFRPESGIIIPGTKDFDRYLATRPPLQRKLLENSLRSGFKGNHADKIVRAFIKNQGQSESRDLAMETVKESKTGGIDLTPTNMNLQTQNSNGEIKFHLDPAQLAQLSNAPGFVPVIISVQPMTNLRLFLGLADNQSVQKAASL